MSNSYNSIVYDITVILVYSQSQISIIFIVFMTDKIIIMIVRDFDRGSTKNKFCASLYLVDKLTTLL